MYTEDEMLMLSGIQHYKFCPRQWALIHCQNYGKRVQNFVFECVLNESQFVSLKHQLEEVVDVIDDSIRFYKLGNNWQNKVEEIGKHSTTDITDLLLI